VRPRTQRRASRHFRRYLRNAVATSAIVRQKSNEGRGASLESTTDAELDGARSVGHSDDRPRGLPDGSRGVGTRRARGGRRRPGDWVLLGRQPRHSARTDRPDVRGGPPVLRAVADGEGARVRDALEALSRLRAHRRGDPRSHEGARRQGVLQCRPRPRAGRSGRAGRDAVRGRESGRSCPASKRRSKPITMRTSNSSCCCTARSRSISASTSDYFDVACSTRPSASCGCCGIRRIPERSTARSTARASTPITVTSPCSRRTRWAASKCARATARGSTCRPQPGAFVCNIGDCLMRWSNDVYVSTPHRVVNRAGRERYSIAYFGDPNADALVDVSCRIVPRAGRDTEVSADHLREYLRSRYDATYGRRPRREPTSLEGVQREHRRGRRRRPTRRRCRAEKVFWSHFCTNCAPVTWVLGALVIGIGLDFRTGLLALVIGNVLGAYAGRPQRDDRAAHRSHADRDFALLVRALRARAFRRR
jgi:hypothetical protein